MRQAKCSEMHANCNDLGPDYTEVWRLIMTEVEKGKTVVW